MSLGLKIGNLLLNVFLSLFFLLIVITETIKAVVVVACQATGVKFNVDFKYNSRLTGSTSRDEAAK